MPDMSVKNEAHELGTKVKPVHGQDVIQMPVCIYEKL